MRGRSNAARDALMQAPGDMLLGLLALATVAMGVFLTYLVLTSGGNLWQSNITQGGV